MDAVYLALPNHMHREYSERAAAAGVHVLCEKPMAVTADECRAMIHAAHHNRVKLMIAYRLHLEAGNLRAIDLARHRKLGELRIFTSEFSQHVSDENVRVTEPVNRGGGPVYDIRPAVARGILSAMAWFHPLTLGGALRLSPIGSCESRST